MSIEWADDGRAAVYSHVEDSDRCVQSFRDAVGEGEGVAAGVERGAGRHSRRYDVAVLVAVAVAVLLLAVWTLFQP